MLLTLCVSRLLLMHVHSVSMVDGQLFNLLANLAAILRKRKDRPFGGIQVSLSWSTHICTPHLLTPKRLL